MFIQKTMKNTLKTLLVVAGCFLFAACGQPKNANDAMSDTSSVYGSGETIRPGSDTGSTSGSNSTDTVISRGMGDNNDQGSRVDLGSDTVGKPSGQR